MTCPADHLLRGFLASCQGWPASTRIQAMSARRGPKVKDAVGAAQRSKILEVGGASADAQRGIPAPSAGNVMPAGAPLPPATSIPAGSALDMLRPLALHTLGAS